MVHPFGDAHTHQLASRRGLRMIPRYRDEGIFYEHVTNTILDDLVAVVEPQWLKVEIAFHARGGITETVTAQFAGSAI